MNLKEKIGEMNLKEKLSFKKPNINIDFRSLFKNRIVLASISIVLSVLIVFGGTFAMDKILNSTINIVRLKSDAPRGTKITSEMLESINAGKLGLAEDILTEIDVAVGKYAAIDLHKGDNLIKSRLSTELPVENDYLYSLGDNEYAISVSIPVLSGSVGGKVRAGDVVTVLAVLQSSEDEKNNYFAISPPELKYVKVLAVSEETGKDIVPEKDNISSKDAAAPADKKETIVSIITFLVNEKQAAAIAGLEQKSQIHLALASRTEEQSEKLLLMQKKYFDTSEGKING